MRLILIITLFTFSNLHSNAQAVTPLGQSPPNLKWQQIQTRHFRVIFPKAIGTDAQRIANALDNAYLDVAASLKSLPRKIPIVMQNQTTDNNAFVSSEGRRAEFFSTPPQNPNNMGMNNWYDELSLHEYRHVVQMDQTRRGWGNLIFYLFGNSGTSVMQGVTNPWWFWEGDAVGCESSMGYGGRGRIPSFDLTFRTQLLEKGAFPYIKAACGSLKNAIPNHYLLGYLLTTYAKNHFGADVWSKILSKTYSIAPLPFSFSRSIKKITGLNADGLYNSMTAEMKALWGQQVSDMHQSDAVVFHEPKEKVFTNYKFPQYLPDGSIVAEKAGLETGSFLAHKSSIVDQSEFVLLTKDGKEKNLRISGVLDDNGVLSSAGDKIVWSEYSYDPRWGARNYTIIKVLDARTKEIRQITHRSRLHAPCFSPDGKWIAAVEISYSNQFSLQILDAATGKLIRKFDNPGNHQFLEPHFTSDGKSILLVMVEPGYKSIAKLDIESGMMKIILQPVAENLSAPVDFDHYILYNSPQSGIDNIYAIDTAGGQVYSVTNRKYGAFNACISPDRSKISFQDFTVNGFRVVEMPLRATEWPKWEGNHDSSAKVEYFKPFAKQEAGNILAHIPDSVYPVSPYKRIRNALKIYSWGIDPITNLPQLSLGIRSVDMLSTTTMEAGYQFDNNEDRWGKYFRFSYQGLYPQFFLEYRDGRRKNVFKGGTADTTGMNFDLIAFHNFSLGTGIPFNFSSGAFTRKLNITAMGIFSDLSQLIKRNNSKKFSKDELGNFFSMQYDAAFELRQRQSLRDVGPRLGTTFLFSLRNTPFKSFYQARQEAWDGSIFLPGFFRHHSIKLRGSFQEDDPTNYHLENRFDFVRNEGNRFFQHLQIWSVDYKLPLCYPDFPVMKGMFYFQRLKADFFTELGIGKNKWGTNSMTQTRYNNYGIELSADVNLLRFLLPFDIGIRGSYLTQNGKMSYGLLFKVPNLF